MPTFADPDMERRYLAYFARLADILTPEEVAEANRLWDAAPQPSDGACNALPAPVSFDVPAAF